MFSVERNGYLLEKHGFRAIKLEPCKNFAMTDLPREEYKILRETIRSRAAARPVVALAGLFAWAVVVVAVLIGLPNPLAAVVPLLVLVGAFEATRSLHLAVERIGRYIQVFFEESLANEDASLAPPAWERTAMIFGPSVPGAGGHPLFLPLFFMATIVNFVAVILPGPLPIELGTLLVPHLAFVLWMLHCDRGMRKQRASELTRFREIKKDSRLRRS